MVRASLVTIGDEILIGQIVDTNGVWIGQELTERGIDVVARFSIGDDRAGIRSTLDLASKNADIVIVTGGLGPTMDDVTKDAIADFFGVETYFDDETFQWIIELFAKYGREPLESHRMQCYLPAGCKKLTNRMGTAPGMHMEKEDTHFFFTPGVPLEMKYIFKNGILPWIDQYFDLPPIVYKTIHTAGEGESVIAEKIASITDQLPEEIKIAFLPGMHQVRVRVLAQGLPDDKAWLLVNKIGDQIAHTLGDIVYGFDGESLAGAVGQLLKERGLKLTLAESCTGGYISHLITAIPGSSAYYEGSIVSYSYALKTSQLDVPEHMLLEYGAVSEEVVIQMARGARERYNCDVALAVSGIAGPDGGTDDKPVGTVWMCVSDSNKHVTKCFQLSKSRVLNIKHTGAIGLNLIRKFLLGSDLA